MQIIVSFWSFEISEIILRNQKIIIGLDSFSRPSRGFGDSGSRAIYFQGFGEKGNLFSGIWGDFGVLRSREQGAEEKHFRDLGRKVIFLSGGREQRPPHGGPHCLTNV